jgi:hypothetical protein
MCFYTAKQVTLQGCSTPHTHTEYSVWIKLESELGNYLVLCTIPLSEIVTKQKPAIRNQNFEVDSVRQRFGQSGPFLKLFLAGGRRIAGLIFGALFYQPHT